MKINTAVFVKGVVSENSILDNGFAQIAFIGRSNVGKSSIINTLTSKKGLAKTSSFPGRTQQINVFLINDRFYLLDLPGYGFAKASKEVQQKLRKLIDWYFFESPYEQSKVVLIIDANIGPTANDLEMLKELEGRNKNIIIIANKIDKIKKSSYQHQLKKIQEIVGHHSIFPCSTATKSGIDELRNEIFN